MKIGIMQPYFFPYIGYFQLINAVDRFIILDDVNYIKKSWINRNRIIVNDIEHYMTLPLQGSSQNKLIRDIYIYNDTKWKNKILKTVELNYKKAPYFNIAFNVFNECISQKETLLTAYLSNQIKIICSFIGINTQIIDTSSIYDKENRIGDERIIDICLKEKAKEYLNPIGGIELYKKSKFIDKEILLFFIKSKDIVYTRNKKSFVPFMSIIDVMMYNSKEKMTSFLYEYELL